jgi:hypothetical protein
MALHDTLASRAPDESLSPTDLVRMSAGDDVAEPYDHFIVGQMFAPGLAEALLEWLVGCDHWFLSEQKFYEQYEFELAGKPLPETVAPLMEPDVLAHLISLCESRFGERLFSGVSIAAHKLAAGQYIGVHNDSPSAQYGMETHRLVVQLNHGEASLTGGELQLFAERAAPAPSRAYRPRHNAGFGFRLTPKSYHAVARVEHGERYSLIFTFRGADGREDDEILTDLPELYRERLFFANSR